MLKPVMNRPLVSLLLCLLCLLFSSPVEARFTLGVVTHGASATLSAAQAEALAAQLGAQLQAEVAVKELADAATLLSWLDRFAMLDLALLSAQDVAANPGRFLLVGPLGAQGELSLVCRQGIAGDLPQRLAGVVRSAGFAPWRPAAAPANQPPPQALPATASPPAAPVTIDAVIAAQVELQHVPPMSPGRAWIPEDKGALHDLLAVAEPTTARLVLGVVAESKNALRSSQQAEQLAAYLEAALPVKVKVREFAHVEAFAEWFTRYRMIDFALLPAELVRANLGRDYEAIASFLRTDRPAGSTELAVMRLGQNEEFQEPLRRVFAQMTHQAAGQALLAQLNISAVTAPQAASDRVVVVEPMPAAASAEQEVAPSRAGPAPDAPAPDESVAVFPVPAAAVVPADLPPPPPPVAGGAAPAPSLRPAAPLAPLAPVIPEVVVPAAPSEPSAGPRHEAPPAIVIAVPLVPQGLPTLVAPVAPAPSPPAPVATVPEPAPPVAQIVIVPVPEPLAPAPVALPARPPQSPSVEPSVLTEISQEPRETFATALVPAVDVVLRSSEPAAAAAGPIAEEQDIIEEVLRFAEAMPADGPSGIRPVVVDEAAEGLSAEDFAALLGEDAVAAVVAQPDIPQELRPSGVPVVRPGRATPRAPLAERELLLAALPEPRKQVEPLRPPKLLPQAEADPGVVYVVPFVSVMVPGAVKARVFDQFVDRLNLQGETLGLQFVILKEGLQRVAPEWLAARRYVTGELYAYVEDSGSSSTELRSRARLKYHRPNQDTPALSFEYPVRSFFDHDRSSLDIERAKLADTVATTLAGELFKALQN